MLYALSVWDYKGNKLIDLKSQDIAIMGQAYGGKLRRNINGLKELDFVLPLYYTNEEGQVVDNFRWDYIRSEALVKLEYRGEYDWFIIKTFDEMRDDGGKLLSNIQCKHISNLLSQSGLDLYIDEEVGNAETLLNLILENSGWTIGELDQFYNKDGTEKIRTLKLERSNRYNAIQDLAELFNAYPRFNPDKTVDFKNEIGRNNGVVFRYGKNLKNIRRTIGNSDVITKLWVEGGMDDVGLVTISDVNPTGENYLLDFSYFIDGGFLTEEQIQAIEDFKVEVKQLNESIGNNLSDVSQEYNDLSLDQSILEGKTLTKAATEQARDETVVKIENENDETEKQTLIEYRDQLNAQIASLEQEILDLKSMVSEKESDISVIENTISSYRLQKDELINSLNLKLSDFMREGLWQDTNYIDSEALYEDAQDQSKNYAYPQVSYEMGIVDLSLLTGYELEKFDLGDIIRIVDDKLKIDTLGRITEQNIDLDNPQDIMVQIGNYYSNFEDLFKKITQSAEVIKQRKQVYERAIGINPNGTINFDILQKTFDQNVFNMINGTNNKVTYGEKGIIIEDLNDPNSLTRINTGGIYSSADGGQNWKMLLSAQGMSGINITGKVPNSKMPNITTYNIADASITNAKIENGAITSAKIGDAEIDTAKIANGSITNALIDVGAVNTAQIADSSITDAKIVDLTANKITSGTLSTERLIIRDPINPENSLIYNINNIDGALQSVRGDTINGEILTERTITADKIVAESITSDEIAAKTITANNIASNTITADSGIIADAAITTAKIGDGQITSAKIGDAEIDTAKIANGSITNALIDVGAVNTAQIADSSITNAKIVDLDANKINADTLSAISADLGTINAGTINGVGISLGGLNNNSGTLNLMDDNGSSIILMNKSGITLSNGASLISDSGVSGDLQYITNGGSLKYLGYEPDSIPEGVQKTGLLFVVYIPDDYVITSSKITLLTSAIRWTNLFDSTSFNGYSRNIKLYIGRSNSGIYREAIYPGSYIDKSNGDWTQVVSGDFISSGFNGSSTTSFSIKNTNNISSHLKQGVNLFKIECGDTYTGSTESEFLKRTGVGVASLVVKGYTKN